MGIFAEPPECRKRRGAGCKPFKINAIVASLLYFHGQARSLLALRRGYLHASGQGSPLYQARRNAAALYSPNSC